MRVSAKAEYACLAVIALAQRRLENRPVPIREIAEAQGIPRSSSFRPRSCSSSKALVSSSAPAVPPAVIAWLGLPRKSPC